MERFVRRLRPQGVQHVGHLLLAQDAGHDDVLYVVEEGAEGAVQVFQVIGAQALQVEFERLQSMVESTSARLDERLSASENRLGRTISHTAVIRYDAYGEMTGRQSSSMALLDDSGTGVVLSSILHREQARMYVKDVRDGQSQFELSPEENEAIEAALQA